MSGKYVDLHIHTRCSDGVVAPDEIPRLAFEAGLEVVAITDHDAVDGIERAFAANGYNGRGAEYNGRGRGRPYFGLLHRLAGSDAFGMDHAVSGEAVGAGTEDGPKAWDIGLGSVH